MFARHPALAVLVAALSQSGEQAASTCIA